MSEEKKTLEKAKPKKERDPELLVFSKNIKEALRLSDMDSGTLAACLSQPEALDLALNNIEFPPKKDMQIISNELHIPLKVLLAPDGVKPFGDILWKFRSKKNLTLRKLGEQLGIDHAILAKYEHRSLYPTRETYEKMIEIFGASFEDQTTLLAEQLRKKEQEKVQKPVQESEEENHQDDEVIKEESPMIEGNNALAITEDVDEKDQDLLVLSKNLKEAIRISGVESRAIRARLSRPEELDMALNGTGFPTNHDLQKIAEELHVPLKVLMTPDGVKPFGEIIGQFRKQEKLTQDQLSELLEITPSSIYLYERCKCYPTKNTYMKMCDIFGAPFEEQTTLLAERFHKIEKKKAQKEKKRKEKIQMQAKKAASKEQSKGKDAYSFGRILKFYRKEKGFTQAEMTNLLGHYNAGIFERGNLPDEEIYRKMVDIFGLQFRKQTMWLFPELDNKTVKQQPVTAPKESELVVKDTAVEQTATTAGEQTATVATVEPVPAETDDKQTSEDIPVVSVKKEEKTVVVTNEDDTIVIKKSLVKALMLFADDHDFRKAVQMLLLGDGGEEVSVTDSVQLQLFKMLMDASK